MKKLMLSLVAVAMTAGLVEAQTNVLSKNAVGYVKIPIESNKIYMVSTPFVDLDTGSDLHSITNLFAGVPNSTVIAVWVPGLQQYQSYGKSARGFWDAAAVTSYVQRGQAVFVKIPSSGGSTNSLFLLGEVPDELTAPTTMQSRVPGLTFTGNPYPASISFTGSAMAASVPNSSVVATWNSIGQTYISYGKSARGFWDLAAVNATIEPGQGFIIKSSAAGNNWNEVKPYTWP